MGCQIRYGLARKSWIAPTELEAVISYTLLGLVADHPLLIQVIPVQMSGWL